MATIRCKCGESGDPEAPDSRLRFSGYRVRRKRVVECRKCGGGIVIGTLWNKYLSMEELLKVKVDWLTRQP